MVYEYRKKIKTLSEMMRIREELKKDRRILVFTNGCFDILHPGHVRLLERASKLGDYLLVAVNSDESIQRLKGMKRPILPLEARLEMVSGLSMVDAVISFEEDSPLDLIEKIKPDVYVKGRGYKITEIPEIEKVMEYGGWVALFPPLSQHSTTAVIEGIKKNA